MGHIEDISQRSFFKSFVEKIEVYDDKVKMYYTIPVSPDSISDEMEGCFTFSTPRLKERGIEGVR